MLCLSPQGRQRLLSFLFVLIVFVGAGALYKTVRVAREVGAYSTYDRISTILVRRLSVPRGAISPEASLAGGFDTTDFDREEFLTAVEEEFQISFRDGESQSLRTVKDVVEAVEWQLRQK